MAVYSTAHGERWNCYVTEVATFSFGHPSALNTHGRFPLYTSLQIFLRAMPLSPTSLLMICQAQRKRRLFIMSTMRRPGNPWQSGLLPSILIDHLAIQFMGSISARRHR